MSIIGTPIADSDGNFYKSIYGDYRTSFSSFDFSLLSGYVKNNEEKIYYLTDSQFVYYFAHLCQINVQDDFSVDGVTIQITDEDKAEFTATFDLYSKNTGTRYGKFKAKFFDVNNTSIPEVTDYLSEGDEP